MMMMMIIVDTAVWMHHLDAKKTAGEEAIRQLHKNVESSIELVLTATPHKTPTIVLYAFCDNLLHSLLM